MIVLRQKVLDTVVHTVLVSNHPDIPPAEARDFFTMLEVLRLIISGSTGSLQPGIQPKVASGSGDRPKIGLR